MVDLSLQNISKKYNGCPVFTDFNLKIEKGEFLFITGVSGKGKSTILNILGLLEPFEQGIYTINGSPAPSIKSRAATKFRRTCFSYIFQDYALVENMTIYHNLRMALEYVQIKDKTQEIERIMGKIGFTKQCLSKKIFQLSGGEQQKVAIARAFLKPSSVILADEPTGSLDEENKWRIMDLLKKLNDEGKTVIIVTHDKEISGMYGRQFVLD